MQYNVPAICSYTFNISSSLTPVTSPSGYNYYWDNWNIFLVSLSRE